MGVDYTNLPAADEAVDLRRPSVAAWRACEALMALTGRLPVHRTHDAAPGRKSGTASMKTQVDPYTNNTAFVVRTVLAWNQNDYVVWFMLHQNSAMLSSARAVYDVLSRWMGVVINSLNDAVREHEYNAHGRTWAPTHVVGSNAIAQNGPLTGLSIDGTVTETALALARAVARTRENAHPVTTGWAKGWVF